MEETLIRIFYLCHRRENNMKKRTYLRKYKIFTLTISFVVFVITIYSIATYDESKYLQTVYPTPVIDKQADEQFVQVYGRGIELNTGLTMDRKRYGVPLEGPTPSPNELLYKLKNNTEEDIVFTNMNAQIFTYNEKGKWIHVYTVKYNPMFLILAPKDQKTSSYDYLDIGDISKEIPYQNLRIFITGLGINSGKKYGAYCDVTIIP